MDKTIREWLEMLPEPYRTQAVEHGERMEAEYPGLMHDTRDSLARAIRSGFAWADTPQGYTYWKDIYNRASRGEFDPKEPQP